MAPPANSDTHTDGTPIRILIVEDDSTLSELLAMTVSAEGWQAQTVADGGVALLEVRKFQPDAIILDIMIPGIDGIEVARRLRERGDDTPILFLTAKDELSDRIKGLKVGGDDYVTKPFSLEELVLRLRALVRRHVHTMSTEEPILIVGDLLMNYETYEVTRGGHPIDLTATEFSLLQFLMENPKRVLSKSQILEHVWNYDFGGKASVVEIYISYLRKKIDALGQPMIHTLRGVGYSIRATDD